MMRRFTSSLVIACLIFVLAAPMAGVQADTAPEAKGLGGAKEFVNKTAFKAGFATDESITPVTVAGALVNTFLSLIGIVFIILIIYAGFKWMTAGGNEEQVNKAKTTIINSVIGIVVVMGAFVIYKFIEGIL